MESERKPRAVLTWIRARCSGRNPGSADVAAASMLAMVFSLAIWSDVARAGLPLIALTAVALALAPHLPVPPAGAAPSAPAAPAGALRSVLIAALIMLPMVVVLVAAAHEEFPWSGDHFWHLRAGSALRRWWLRRIPETVVFALALAVLRRYRVRHWAVIGFAALVLWSLFWHASGFAARYPASGYLLGLPLHLALDRVAHDWPVLLLDRISRAASVPVWLLVLRPIIVKRWPDVDILPLGLMLFWQKDMVYFTTSVYLEPWAVVLVLLAAELAISELPHRTWLAPLVAGAAACFKEPAALIVPWISLASLGALPRTRRAWSAAALNGCLAMLPFLMYWEFRTRHHVRRTASLAQASELWSSERVVLYGQRVIEQFGTSGIVLLALSLLALVVMAWKDRSRRWSAACLVAGAITVAGFFYIDAASIWWTGYSRFAMISLAAIAAAAWIPGDRLRAARRFRPWAIAAAVVVALLQAPTLGPYLTRYTEPDPTRNFIEFTDAPVYYPIHALVSDARRADAIARGATITVQQFNVGAENASAVDSTYPALSAEYHFLALATNCRCTNERRSLLVPVVYPTGLLSTPGALPLSAEVTACVAAVRETYARVFERSIDGYPTGLLGVGCKPPATVSSPE